MLEKDTLYIQLRKGDAKSVNGDMYAPTNGLIYFGNRLIHNYTVPSLMLPSFIRKSLKIPTIPSLPAGNQLMIIGKPALPHHYIGMPILAGIGGGSPPTRLPTGPMMRVGRVPMSCVYSNDGTAFCTE